MSFDVWVVLDSWPKFAIGLGNTVLVCLVSLPAGFVLGLLLALARLRGGRAIGVAIGGYVEIFRNIPFLIQVFLLFYALPMFGVRLSPLVVSVVALSGYASAYVAEILRGAMLSIPKGQTEAGFALGLRFPMIFWKILLPQVLGYVLPATCNLAITLVKESALLSTITVVELTYAAQDVVGQTFSPVEVFTTIAVLYWCLTALIAAGSRFLERRLQPHVVAVRDS